MAGCPAAWKDSWLHVAGRPPALKDSWIHVGGVQQGFCLLFASVFPSPALVLLKFPSVLEFATKPLSEKKIIGILQRAADVLNR